MFSKKRISVSAALVLIFIFGIFIFLPNNKVFALNAFSAQSNIDKTMSATYYLMMQECISGGHYNGTIYDDKLSSIFTSDVTRATGGNKPNHHTEIVGYFAEKKAKDFGYESGSTEGKLDCENNAEAAFKLWGLDGSSAAELEKSGYKKETSQKTYQCLGSYYASSTDTTQIRPPIRGDGQYGTWKTSPAFPLPLSYEQALNLDSAGLGKAFTSLWGIGGDDIVNETSVKNLCRTLDTQIFQYLNIEPYFDLVDGVTQSKFTLSDGPAFILRYIKEFVLGTDATATFTTKESNTPMRLTPGLTYYYLNKNFTDKTVCGAVDRGIATTFKSSLDDVERNNAENNNTYGGFTYLEANVLSISADNTIIMASHAFTIEGDKKDQKIPLWAKTEKTCLEIGKAIDAQSKAIDIKVDQGEGDKYKALIGELGQEESEEQESTEEVSTCEVEGVVGWFLCPVVHFLTRTADKAYGYISKEFLVLPVGENGLLNDETKAVWTQFTTLANIAFIIAFLIIIFSQLTSVGIDNFGIKKMLPKLIVAVILVNLSFFICQLAVDLSNIVGNSVTRFFGDNFSAISSSYSSDSEINISIGADTGMYGVGRVILVGTVAGALMAALGVLIPVVIGAIVSCVMILLILEARKALIVILAILAPLAFVAYLLPNTEKAFTLWKKTFMSMLLLYPITSFVFAASHLASGVLSNAADSSSSQVNDASAIAQVLAAAVAVLPLFIVPGLLKKSLDGIAGIGNMVSKISSKADGWGKGASKKITDKYKNSEFGKYRAAEKTDRKTRTSLGIYTGRNPLRRGASSANRWLNRNSVFNAATGAYGSKKLLSIPKKEKEDTTEAVETFDGDYAVMSAMALGGGSKTHPNYLALNNEQRQKYDQMVSRDLHLKPSTYVAAAKALSEAGEGTGAQVNRALEQANDLGMSDTDYGVAARAAISAYMKAGRGDQAADLSNRVAGRPNHIATGINPMTPEEGFRRVAATALNRHSFDDPANLAVYQRMLHNNFNKVVETTRNWASIDPQTQTIIQPHLLTEAQYHANEKYQRDLTAYNNAVAAATTAGAPLPTNRPVQPAGGIEELASYLSKK